MSSIASCCSTKAKASREAPFCWAIVRNVSGSCRFAGLDLAALEQRAEARERRLQAGVGPRDADRRVDGVAIARERLEVEGAGMVEHVEEHLRVGERERAVGGRERALVEQRDRLALHELEVAEDAVGEVGHLREVALADRAERADDREAGRR